MRGVKIIDQKEMKTSPIHEVNIERRDRKEKEKERKKKQSKSLTRIKATVKANEMVG